MSIDTGFRGSMTTMGDGTEGGGLGEMVTVLRAFLLGQIGGFHAQG